jgi:hypothetical protein
VGRRHNDTKLEERHRGIRIIASEQHGAWQARAEGIGALSRLRSSPHEAIAEIRQYLDEAVRAYI